MFTDKFIETYSTIDTSVKSKNTGVSIVVYLVLIMDVTYHYRLCTNVTICHVTSLARTKARKPCLGASLDHLPFRA
jgi:hypothetical protein